MNHARYIAPLLGLALAASAAPGWCADAAPAAAPARASFCGTVRIEPHHCVIVHPMQVGQPDYDISSASPAPTNGELIGGSGTVRKTSVCNEKYVALAKVTWKKADVCALGD